MPAPIGASQDDVDVEAGSVEAEQSALIAGSLALTPTDPATLPIVVVLVGRVGSGKSSTANTLVGQVAEPFTARRSAAAVTGTCRAETVQLDNDQAIVLDTPGLGDAATPDPEILKEIRRGLEDFTNVESAVSVIWVTSLQSRLGEDDFTTLSILQDKIFGRQMMKHTMVLWTHADCLDDSGLDGFLRGAGDRADELLKSFEGGIFAVDNRHVRQADESMPPQVQEIFKQARAIGKQFLVIREREDRTFGRKSARRKRQMEAGLLQRATQPPPETGCTVS